MPVRVHGLKAAPEFNGEEGVCVRWDASRGRWQVRLRTGSVKVLKPDNLEELYSWSVHNGYISQGDEVLRAKMTIAEAIVKCAALPECRGFSFAGGLTDEPVDILFKSKFDLVPEGRGWLSYQKVRTESQGPESESFRAELERQQRQREEEERVRLAAEEARRIAREAREGERRRVEEAAAERRRARAREWQREEEARQRPDYGKPTAKFDVGDVCEVINGIIVRREEDLDSQQLRQLPNRASVEVVEIGTGPTGKRLLVRDRYKREGWVSAVAATGDPLLRVVKRPEPPGPDGSGGGEGGEQGDKDIDVVVEVDLDSAPYYLDMLQARLQEEGLETFDPRHCHIFDASGAEFALDAPLPPHEEVEWPLQIEYAPPRDRAPAEILPEYKGLPAASLGAWRPDAMPVGSLASMLVSTVFEQMTYNHAKSRSALKILEEGGKPCLPALKDQTERPRPALPWDSASGAADGGGSKEERSLVADAPRLGALEKSFREAVAQDDKKALQAVLKKVEDIGMMPDCIRQHLYKNWRGALGYEPYEYKGRIYTMRSIDKCIFDKTMDFPVAMLNPASKRVEPVKGRLRGCEYETINFFDRTYHVMPRGEMIDPVEGMIVGAYNPDTMLIEAIEPVPIKWKEFMDTRGFRLESGTSSSSSSRRPFIQILGPKHASLFGLSKDEVAGSLGGQAGGSWKMLKSAGKEVRGDRDLVLQTLRQGARQGSWQVLLHAPQKIRDDREVVLEAVKQDPDALTLAGESLRQDRDLVLAAVRSHALALRHADERLRDDRALVLEAVRCSWRALGFASEAMRGDRELALEAIRQSWQALEHVSDELCADRDLVQEAIRQSWRAVQFAAEELRGDSELMLSAIAQSPQALSYIRRSLLDDRGFVSQVVRAHGHALRHAPYEFRADREIVLLAVCQDWRALHFAAPDLKGNAEIVARAVAQDWQALRLAAPPALERPELLLGALRRSPAAIALVPESLLADRDFVLEVVRVHWESLRHVAPHLRADPGVVAEAARIDPAAFRLAAPALRSNRGFLLGLVRDGGCPGAFAWAEDGLRGDRELAAEAALRDFSLLARASPELLDDRSFVLGVVRVQGLALSFASEALQADRGVVLAAVRSSGQALEHAAEALRGDAEIVLEAVRQDWEALDFAPEELRFSRHFMLGAVQANGQALRYASEELREDEELVLEAVRSNWRALRFASLDLRRGRRFLERVAEVDPLALAFASEDLRNDSELVMQSIEAAAERPPLRASLESVAFAASGAGAGLPANAPGAIAGKPGPPPGSQPLGLLGGGFLAGGARRPAGRGAGRAPQGPPR